MISDCIVIGLSVCAFVYIVRNTDGPFDIFYHFRTWIGLHDDNPDTFFGMLVNCVWCFSTWVSLAMTILYFFAYKHDILTFPIIWFAAIYISVFMYRLVDAMEELLEKYIYQEE